MRIVSKFRDYYDGVQALGQDKNRLFFRTEQSFERYPLECDPWKTSSKFPLGVSGLYANFVEVSPQTLYKRGLFRVMPLWVLFAGKVYPAACVEKTEGLTRSNEFFYDLGPLRDVLIAEEFSESCIEDATKPSRKGAPSWHQFFQVGQPTKVVELLVSGQIAVAVATRASLTLNAKLADFEFYKRLDAWQAYQELGMFFGNLTAPENNSTEIPDKYRIPQHGFDEWSFRKRPSD
ncbi:hypothetical protein LC612_38925 [Nostoc sp. CHAB 5834]|nr:hypothetical protein [Nostoc sp. CHAB 5834]